MAKDAICDYVRRHPISATRLTAAPAEMSLASSSALPAELLESIESMMPAIANAVEKQTLPSDETSEKSEKYAPFIGMLASSEPSNSSASEAEPEGNDPMRWKLPVTSESSDTDLDPDPEDKDLFN